MTLYEDAADRLKALGLTLSKDGAQYRVNYPHGQAERAYATDDLDDALRQGQRMADDPPPIPPPPLGPLGAHVSRRGFMYRHNRKVAARRKRRAQAERA